MLALRANRRSAADELIDGLWGDRPPASAAKQPYPTTSPGFARHWAPTARGPRSSPAAGVRAPAASRRRHWTRRDSSAWSIEPGQRRSRGSPMARYAARSSCGAVTRSPTSPRSPSPAPRSAGWRSFTCARSSWRSTAELAAGRHREVIGRARGADRRAPASASASMPSACSRFTAPGGSPRRWRATATRAAPWSRRSGSSPGPELRAPSGGDPRARTPPSTHRPPPAASYRASSRAAPRCSPGRERELRWLRERWARGRRRRPARAGRGPAGIGKTRLAASSRTRFSATGAPVLYAAGSGAPTPRWRRSAPRSRSARPTLLVLDDADDASPDDARGRLGPRGRAARLGRFSCSCCTATRGPAGLRRRGADGSPLRPCGPRPPPRSPSSTRRPTASRCRSTRCWPRAGRAARIHRAASGWAQAQAAERLEATGGQDGRPSAAASRGVEAEVAGGIAELQVAVRATQPLPRRRAV